MALVPADPGAEAGAYCNALFTSGVCCIAFAFDTPAYCSALLLLLLLLLVPSAFATGPAVVAVVAAAVEVGTVGPVDADVVEVGPACVGPTPVCFDGALLVDCSGLVACSGCTCTIGTTGVCDCDCD